MELTSNFNEDFSQEAIITDYIFNVLFKNYFDTTYKSNSILITDKKNQMKGIDILVEDLKYNISINFDLKSQSTYINKPLPTFALETSYKNKYNEDKIGWFINSELETHFYGFVWIHQATLTDGKITSKDDFKKIEVMFVNKREIIKALDNLGLNKEKIIEISKEMRDESIETNIFNDIKFRLTKGLQEKPVNIVLKKTFYKKICNQHFMIENHIPKLLD